MKDRSFPRWAGPLVGVWLGIYIQARQVRFGGLVDWLHVAIGAGCGLLAGMVIWLADAPPADEHRVSSTGGELLAALGWVVVILPGINVLVNAASVRVNRGVRDWPGKWSRVALGSSLLVSALFVGLLAY